MNAPSWSLVVVVTLWAFAAIGMDPRDYRGRARLAVLGSRILVLLVAAAIVTAYILGLFLPPVIDGIDPKYPL